MIFTNTVKYDCLISIILEYIRNFRSVSLAIRDVKSISTVLRAIYAFGPKDYVKVKNREIKKKKKYMLDKLIFRGVKNQNKTVNTFFSFSFFI